MENKIEAIVKEPSLENLKGIRYKLLQSPPIAGWKKKLEAIDCQIKRIEAIGQKKD